MDTACHHLDTPRKERIKRKTGETLERRTRRLLEGYHLAEDSAKIVKYGINMLRLSPNDGTLWLNNDDDYDEVEMGRSCGKEARSRIGKESRCRKGGGE